MKARRWLVPGFVLAACTAPLPEPTPLGEGPAVRAESLARAKSEADAGQVEGGGPQGTKAPKAASPPKTVEVPTPPVDAGTADSKVASPTEGDAGKPIAPAAAAVKWAGLYVGSDVSVYRLAGKPDQTDTDDAAKTRVEDRTDGGVDLIPISSSDGTEICTVKAMPKDAARKLFELTPGQGCFESATGGVTGTVRSGTARFDGKKLVLELILDLEIAPPVSLKGVLDYRYEGTRQ